MSVSEYKPHSIDVAIIGAGISGINAAYRLQTQLPNVTYKVFEARSSIGGTWDLFRYPGIRSDSDVASFAFEWRPWPNDQVLAAGGDIKQYIKDSAKDTGIEEHILYEHKVLGADWSSVENAWALHVQPEGKETKTYTARFVLLSTGYYDYNEPLKAAIPGIDSFGGQIVHPQFWPENLDTHDKEIVVIGSGATAITLIPALAESAKRITMLQRSPTYIASQARNNTLADFMKSWLPPNLARRATRLVRILRGYFFYYYCQYYPDKAIEKLKKVTSAQLPPELPYNPHFQPLYRPWEQRFCVAPGGDFFKALRSGKATVVTDRIKQVTKTGIMLESGDVLQPDIIITATGLKLHFAGGIKMSIDGEQLNPSEKMAWKGSMIQDVPNCFFVLGYENASWTLGADVTSHLMVRMLRSMQKAGYRAVVPRADQAQNMPTKPLLSLSSTYLKNMRDVFPRAGSGQWSPKRFYFADMWRARFGNMSSGLQFR